MAYDKKYKRRHAARRFGRLRLKRGSAAFPESGGILMYQQEYERWLAAELEDKDLKPELLSIQGIDAEIQDRFAVELEFGTAGLRGVLGAGTNRMNIYMVRKATQGLANYLNKQGGIEYIGQDTIEALYENIKAQSVRPGLCKTAGLKLVYSPLNGSGLVPVTRVLGDIGITDITIVPEQQYPDGNFPTCPYPTPEIREALALGLALAEKSGADLMLATDPDADRVGIAVRCKDGSYQLLSGNEVGVLLLDYICKGRTENGTMPKAPVCVKSIVSTPLADVVAAHYGVECRNVLTGFKWIGDQIAGLEAAGEVERFIFGFEESYGYLAGSYVRDKDAVVGSMLICEMAAYYRSIGSSIKEELERIYAEYGRYLNKVNSYEFPGLSGMETMAGIMTKLRENPPAEFAGYKVVTVADYKARTKTDVATGKTEPIELPAANVLIYTLAGGASVVVRPSGTEPKFKTYFTTLGKDLAEAEAQQKALAAAVEPLLK